MRKSFVALALLVGAATMLTTVAFAQDSREVVPERAWNARTAQQLRLQHATRLGTSADADTMWIGHNGTGPWAADNPWHIGAGAYRPGVGGKYDNMWDFDTYDGGTIDSMQGWVPTASPIVFAGSLVADNTRPWGCLDWGNRINASPKQGRTPGIVSAWHVDGGNKTVSTGAATASPTWNPLAGNASAWCGLRAGDDKSVIESKDLGGTGNAINGRVVFGVMGNGLTPYTLHLFPGYCNQWDQMLYRDVRVATGASLTVSFAYQTLMDPRANSVENACTGWFNKDPLSMNQGGTGFDASNFISATAYLGLLPRTGPVDSFMVYVGVPANPEACQYTDLNQPRPIFDLKRRWFSEVLAIDKPYKEILSTFGSDSAYKSSSAPFSCEVANGIIEPMLQSQESQDGGGVIRIVFRSKTNRVYSDEVAGQAFTSGSQGAVRIDEVAISGAADPFTTSGFETADEINNTVEGANALTPGPAVGEGYALGAWHSTGKPVRLMAHVHPLFGRNLGDGDIYSPLAYADLCGTPYSAIRQCNIYNVVMSGTDHNLGDRPGIGSTGPFSSDRSGFLSPAINMMTPETGPNNMGIDRVHVETDAHWWLWYDIYTGIFRTSTQGNWWMNTIQCYPATQQNGARVWADIGPPTGAWSSSDKQCGFMLDDMTAGLKTTNPTGIPDSVKVWIEREQRCIYQNVTVGCSPSDGFYVDNVALMLPPPTAGVSELITVEIWDWYTDAFPANETLGLPGTAAFDTCGALIQNARNNSPLTGNLLRFDIPGDSVFVQGANGDGTPLRMDCVFRILPGPGNYTVIGNKTTPLRRVPSSATAVVKGDGSFWGQYQVNNGDFGSPGGHPLSGTRWGADVWNSVRIDSVEVNIFPVEGKVINLPGFATDNWMSTIHESDPHFGVLGILKNKCFLVDTSGPAPVNATNIECDGYPPVWLSTAPYQIRAGYDNTVGAVTREYTKIFPSGLLTAGSHVEYFFRQSHLSTPGTFVMAPDTNRITPQTMSGAWDTDGWRYQGFSILPDRWKDAGYGGLGSACMLVVDNDDRGGGGSGERSWVGLADSIGATVAAKYGAHNGWHATAAYVASDGSHDYTWENDCGTNPAIAVWKHGQAGTTWDLYNVKASESSTTGTCQIGSRLASRANMGLMTGKQSMQGPTGDMLRAYYSMLFIMSAGLNNTFFGAVTDRGQDDIALVHNFLTFGASELTPRGIWVMGNGFAEANTGIDAAHSNFLTTDLAASLRNKSHYALSGATTAFVDLIPTSVVNSAGAVFSVQNSCLFTNDVLNVIPAVSGATPGSYYQNTGYVSGVYAPSTSGHPFVSLLDGWDMTTMFSNGGGNTVGRLVYCMDVLVNTFGSVCGFTAAPTIDVPTNTVRNVDFLGNVWGNPMVAGGKATVHFGLAKKDRVEVKVYDVTGRLVRSLADRTFQAGEYSLIWDGSNDQGQVVPRGVYFTQVKFINSRFMDAKKVTVLK